MRVLYWTPYFAPDIGGIEVLSSRLIPELQRRGHEFTVVTSYGARSAPAEASLGDVPVKRFRFAEALAARDVREVAMLLREMSTLKRTFRPELVHLHHPGSATFFHLNTASAHVSPMLLSIHTPIGDIGPGSRLDSVVARSLRAASWVTTVSIATRAEVLRWAPEIGERCSVVYNGMNEPAEPPTSPPCEPPRLLCVGRLSPEKGIDLALDALVSIREQVPQTHLTIVGDGPARAALERQSARLGLSSSVTFAGWVPPDRVQVFMTAATLVIVPSRYQEPFGLVALEAAMAARAVIAARTGGLPEAIEDGVTGVLFDPGDARALAAAVLATLSRTDEVRRLGEAGCRRARAKFSLPGCVSAYDALYRGLGATRKP